MKIFTSYRVLLHSEWMRALGEPRHHQQGNILIVAPDKARAQSMLGARSSAGTAYRIRQSLRMVNTKIALPTDVDALLRAHIVSPSLPGVFIWYKAIIDKPVVLVQPDGSLPVVGHFRLGPAPGYELYAERAGKDSNDQAD